MKPLFKKAAGPSDCGTKTWRWNNLGLGTTGPVVCQLCGTKHPKREHDPYTMGLFLGSEFVEECCGATLDQVYRESAEVFIIDFLQEFIDDPGALRFYVLRSTLEDALYALIQKAPTEAKAILAALNSWR